MSDRRPFRRDEPVVVLASPDARGLIGKTGRIANVRPPADGRWQVAELREHAVDMRIGFPTFTAEQLRAA